MGKYKCKRCHSVVIAKLPNCPECSSSDGYEVVKAIEHNHAMDAVYHPHCPRCKLNEVAPELLEVLLRTKAYLASLPGKYAAESRYLQESVKGAINKTKA